MIEASGDYIWFIDIDDWIDDNALFRIAHFLCNNGNIDLLRIGCAVHGVNGRYVEILPEILDDFEDILHCYLQLRKKTEPIVMTYIYSRELLLDNKLKFEESVHYEDIAFTGKVFFYAKNVEVLPEPLYHYNRTNELSITSIHSKRKTLDLLRAYDDLRDFLEVHKIFEDYKGSLIMGFLVQGLSSCFKMFLALSKSERNDPFLKEELFSYKKSAIMSKTSLKNTLSFAHDLPKEEEAVKQRYIHEIGSLYWVKNALIPLRIKRQLIIWAENFKK